jgi:hypothetical protein
MLRPTKDHAGNTFVYDGLGERLRFARLRFMASALGLHDHAASVLAFLLTSS